MARIVLQSVCKLYPGSAGERVVALREVNLTIEDQELMVLVGPSGCGKSTTLRLIAGLEEPSSGTIAIEGRVVNRLAPGDRDVAMVFQSCALYPHLTAYENMSFGLKLRKCPPAQIDRRVREAASLLGITALLGRLPEALSGGQRQRVAVGRAMVRQPKAFLLDEPLSNLDAPMRGQMRLEIAKLHRRLATTMVYVTHDQMEAMTMGDRIAVMNEGAIQQIADPLSLYQRPANLFVAVFIGSPPMNLLRGRLTGTAGGLVFEVAAEHGLSDTTSLQLQLSPEAAGRLAPRRDTELVLGVRPEDLHLGRPPSDSTPAASWSGVVELVEPLGAETLVHLLVGGRAFVARSSGQPRFGVGQSVAVWPDPAKCHFFDATTESRIE